MEWFFALSDFGSLLTGESRELGDDALPRLILKPFAAQVEGKGIDGVCGAGECLNLELYAGWFIRAENVTMPERGWPSTVAKVMRSGSHSTTRT